MLKDVPRCRVQKLPGRLARVSAQIRELQGYNELRDRYWTLLRLAIEAGEPRIDDMLSAEGFADCKYRPLSLSLAKYRGTRLCLSLQLDLKEFLREREFVLSSIEHILMERLGCS